jgi:hypothetical protein
VITFGPGEVVVVFDGRIAVGGCYREGVLEESGKDPQRLKTYNVTFQSMKERLPVGKAVENVETLKPMIYLAFTNAQSIDVVIERLSLLKNKMKEGFNEQETSI